jgi:hypothetical protein
VVIDRHAVVEDGEGVDRRLGFVDPEKGAAEPGTAQGERQQQERRQESLLAHEHRPWALFATPPGAA